MTGLVLTSDRRNELVTMLEDGARFRADYPVVADYLETAPRLAGTDDPEADAAFDLRLLHYMTGGVSESGNPYWDIVGPSVREGDGRRVINGGRAQGSVRLGYAQTILQAAYAYAVPSPETLQWITDQCASRLVVELGAGRGYWAALLAAAGCQVAAFDSAPPTRGDNDSFPRRPGQLDGWFEVGALDAHPGWNGAEALFLCWPPGWGNTMASTALGEYSAAGGDLLIYVGELKGGKTGDDAFFDVLAREWQLDSQDDRFVSWWNLGDVAQCWRRR
ncbi:hypothetical protein [Nocardia brasiliensis]|uniref:hypothetical protein n=1 Tax=Nocardia brasiliensis TaxID=37326 RepID=UPI002455DB92|nr:hypothetical protein [Nocardia brasiliensis]